jgi:hypothetical protein
VNLDWGVERLYRLLRLSVGRNGLKGLNHALHKSNEHDGIDKSLIRPIQNKQTPCLHPRSIYPPLRMVYVAVIRGEPVWALRCPVGRECGLEGLNHA